MSPRGSPLNVGFEFSPSHPVVRTHPVTGWKSLFAGVGLHVSRIDGVTTYEDQLVREYCLRLLTRNHDCVARMHWTRGACAIWSNVCTLHAATVRLSYRPILSPWPCMLPLTMPYRSPILTWRRVSERAYGLRVSGRCRTWTPPVPGGGRRWDCSVSEGDSAPAILIR